MVYRRSEAARGAPTLWPGCSAAFRCASLPPHAAHNLNSFSTRISWKTMSKALLKSGQMIPTALPPQRWGSWPKPTPPSPFPFLFQMPPQPATIIQQLPQPPPLITQIPPPQPFAAPRSGSIKEGEVPPV